MRLNQIITIVVVFAIAAMSAWSVVVLADHIGRQDRAHFAQYDASRHQTLALACGSSGRLWMDPASNQYGCLYVNSDGTAMLKEMAY